MSANDPKRTSDGRSGMSALSQKADMVTAGVPEGDCLDFICTLTKGTPANF